VIAARLLGVPCVVKLHGSDINLIAKLPGPRRLLSWALPQAERIVAVSRALADEVVELGVPRDKVAVVMNGVDAELFHPRDRAAARAELGLPPGTRLLVFAGRFSAEKNIPVLLDAFRQLGEPYHALLIGGDESGRAGNVTRIPYCCDNRVLASYYASADALVHAGVHETFGLVVLEAMACGRPVVAMRAGAMPEIVAPRTGVLAEPAEDPAIASRNLAAAVAELYEKDLDAAGAAARRHVLANFSWNRALQTLMARYQAAAGVRHLPATAETLFSRMN